ncbi:MAG TPA: M20/M25/M40 family metallo-hydrolase [bacterium]|nr:M20/M25/M40 family metallo-hydrolase [bacterium]
MRAESRDFLVRLLDEPAPSSFEAPAQSIWREYVESFVDRVESDVYGNQTAVMQGTDDISVMVVGHSDEVGLIVKRIDDSGVLWFGKIGGVDPAVLPGTRVRVLTSKGVVPGVIGLPAIHLLPRGETSKKPKLTELTIDVGAGDAKEAKRLVSVGDPVVFGEDFRDLNGRFASHRAFDNRMGCWIVAEMLRTLSRRRARKATVYGVSSVQEETGVWGAGLVADRYLPSVAIAVDVTHDTTTPGITGSHFADVKCGRGPVLTRGVRTSQRVFELLRKAAGAAKIPVQIEIDEGSTWTDADAISARRTGVPVGSVSVACRYMHTPAEVIHLGDVEQTAALLARFVGLLSDKVDLRPAGSP